jgi:predicted DNA-binding transcriptional regulator YafY
MHRDLLCGAIHGKRLLEFRYRDEQLRVVEPHQVGETSDGRELVLAWLVRVQNGSDQNGWRLFRMAEVRDLRILEERFGDPRPDFNSSARYFAVTHCSLHAEVRRAAPPPEHSGIPAADRGDGSGPPPDR